MGRKLREKRLEREETPCDCPKQPVTAEDAGFIVGRADLAQASSAVLYKLLVLKNVPGRSKLHAKVARIHALEGRVTAADCASIGLPTNSLAGDPRGAPAPKKHYHVKLPEDFAPQPRPSWTGTPRVRKPQEGERFEVPVSGIDVHTDPLVVAVADPAGIIAEGTFPYSEDGIEDIKRFLRCHHVNHVAMESTSEYWLRVFWALKEAGFSALVANPVQTKAVQGQKTDKYDARRIALAFRDGRLKPSVLCTPEQYTRRKLSRDAIKRTKQGAKAASRLRMLYHVFGAPEWVTDLHTTQRGRRVLRRCLALNPILATPFEDVEQVITEEYAKYKGKVEDPAEILQMTAEVVAFFYHLDKVPGSRLRLTEYLEDYASNRRLAEQLREEVLRQVGQDPALRRNLQLLLSIPGVGDETALTILVELVDVRFFWSAKALAKWAGLAARVSQSGYKKRATGHIYKGGNKYLREACYLVAKAEHSHAGAGGHPVGEFALRLQHGDKKKPYKVAVTAAARHVLTYVYHVLTEQKPFEALWAEEAPARVEANRQRKLRALEKTLDRVSMDDLLPRVVNALRRRCDELEGAEDAFALLVGEVLGTPPGVVPS